MKTNRPITCEEFFASELSKCFKPYNNYENIFVLESSNELNHLYKTSNGQQEQFKFGFPATVAISNFGSIISLSRNALKSNIPMLCRYYQTREGYNVISRHYGTETVRVGRLVALEFCEKPEDATEVDHVDGNKQNDCAINLNWATHKQNMNNVKSRKPRHKWNSFDYAIMIDVKGIAPCNIVYPSKLYSLTKSTNISNCLFRKTRKSCKGWYLLLNPTIDEINELLLHKGLLDKVSFDHSEIAAKRKVFEASQKVNEEN